MEIKIVKTYDFTVDTDKIADKVLEKADSDLQVRAHYGIWSDLDERNIDLDYGDIDWETKKKIINEVEIKIIEKLVDKYIK